ncbi:hypothetical protein BCIN_01g04150 [Botrytis cinerea B05.10]|uniref:Uncharacterized protein n=1 Tax=Botryotinia fuckeliana (strain B05.10) TaxID=332648 RepID=A0A384J5F8_BOTFB|nr:hypothetical protein BCIN_01g04150 [Botrytis cinerea B05.10]ATZ45674.1 hypothetical protein BCIN_01g04150 [Botrytis cinerea B05.10]
MASEYAGAGEWYNGENSGLTDDDDDEGLFRAANNIGDEFGNWDEDSNPGDQVLWYGQYKGHKYDQLPPSYVEWTIEKYLKSPDTASPNIKGFKALHDRKQVWIEKNVSKLPPPGKEIIWFGQHTGTAFDKLDYGYVMSLYNNYYKEGDRALPSVR